MRFRLKGIELNFKCLCVPVETSLEVRLFIDEAVLLTVVAVVSRVSKRRI